MLAPVIQSLMNENRIERLKIYNGIKDQKINYLNQWHQDTEDFYGRNRAEAADVINRMQEAYADYTKSFNTYRALMDTQAAMTKTRSLDSSEVQKQDKDAEVIAGFETQAAILNQKKDEFSDYMDRLKENIDEKAAQFGYIPYYEATLRDNEYRDIARSTDQVQELDFRRKKLVAISPYIAAYANIPPAPSVEQSMYDDFSIDLLKEAADMEASAAAAEEAAAVAAAEALARETPPPAAEPIPEENSETEELPQETQSPEKTAATEEEDFIDSGDDEAEDEGDDDDAEEDEDYIEEDDEDEEDEDEDEEDR
ncbi:hypothetical protein AGMMS49944_12730 [Spirochaetia bacterium]|nr:hypothetical protein AGMMS49944_12730 [Spirochaetia bacterium]